MTVGAFIKFNKGMLGMDLPVRLWLLVLIFANMVAPLFFLDRFEAQLVLAAFMAGGMFMTILTGWSGFTRLLGLGHIFWIPLLYFLWFRLDQIPSDDLFGIWIRVLMALDALSLVFDAIEVIRYIAGDRKEVVAGL